MMLMLELVECSRCLPTVPLIKLCALLCNKLRRSFGCSSATADGADDGADDDDDDTMKLQLFEINWFQSVKFTVWVYQQSW